MRRKNLQFFIIVLSRYSVPSYVFIKYFNLLVLQTHVLVEKQDTSPVRYVFESLGTRSVHLESGWVFQRLGNPDLTLSLKRKEKKKKERKVNW